MKFKNSLLAIGVLAHLVAFYFACLESLPLKAAMSVTAATMAIWWIFEVIPLAVTALLPLVSYPMLGIAASRQVAPLYMNSTLFLFVGGFLVAQGMQKVGLHRRIALNILAACGGKPHQILIGFMISTASLSMWISNTATTVMMVSIGIAVIKHYEEIFGKGKAATAFGVGVLLAIAYSASVGGMATPIGTPPNLAFTRIFAMHFPDKEAIAFGQWMSFGLPLAMLLLFCIGLVLFKLQFHGKGIAAIEQDFLHQAKADLGQMKRNEVAVASVFAMMAVAWITRKKLAIGGIAIPGWNQFLPYPELLDDGTVAVAAALLLFIIRGGQKDAAILDSKDISQIPWHTILLFGGGFALAKGMQTSGLADSLGNALASFQLSPAGTIVAATAFMTFLTELTSNMSSTEMLLPIVASAAESMEAEPRQLMIAVTLAASCAFMLPAATAPNAIIFGSGYVKIKDMVKAGVFANIFAIAVISMVMMLF